MAEKISTVVIKVDLSCSSCSRKIRKALCILQEQFTITSIAFDEKNNTITVSGPFDPDYFIKKICCLARRVIKDIHVKKPDPKPPPPQEPPKPPPPPPPPPPPIEVVVKFPERPVPPAMCPVCCNQPWPFPPAVCPVCCNQPWPTPPTVWPGCCNQPWPTPPTVWPGCCNQPWPCVDPRPGCRCSCGPGERPPHGSRPSFDPECFKIVCQNEPSFGCSIV